MKVADDTELMKGAFEAWSATAQVPFVDLSFKEVVSLAFAAGWSHGAGASEAIKVSRETLEDRR